MAYLISFSICVFIVSLFLLCIEIYRKCINEDEGTTNLWMLIAILSWIGLFLMFTVYVSMR